MSHFTERQCAIAVNVAKTAMLEGLTREKLLELIGTAWDVLNSERAPAESPDHRTRVSDEEVW